MQELENRITLMMNLKFNRLSYDLQESLLRVETKLHEIGCGGLQRECNDPGGKDAIWRATEENQSPQNDLEPNIEDDTLSMSSSSAGLVHFCRQCNISLTTSSADIGEQKESRLH